MSETRAAPRPIRFGSSWTETKLDIIEAYLNSYTNVMKGQPFRLLYIDAFAGSGQVEIATDDPEGNAVLRGSAERAIGVKDREFDRLVLIEKDPQRCKELTVLRDSHSGRDIHIMNEDANVALRSLTPGWGGWRGVVFLDPFATELEWATIESIARTRALDTWILFPIGAIRRLLPRWKKPEDVSEQWAARLNRIYGGDSWQSLYAPSEQRSLFGEPADRSDPGVGGLLRIYKDRLRGLFGRRFLEESATLKNSRGRPLFELIFVVGSPSAAAIGRATDIAGYLLSKI